MLYKNNGLELYKVGLGCMGMVNTESRAENIATIHKALDSGINLINTGDFYGSGKSEMAVGEALKGQKREKAFVSVKFGVLFEPNGAMYGLDVRPFTIKNYLTHTLKRLNLDYIDLYQPARIDLGIPVEETIGAISELVKAGYVKHVGITQVDSDTLRRAHATHPISLIESEYSLFNRGIEKDIIPVARELGIGVVAFGALAHGLLSGSYSNDGSNRFSSRIPIFFKENIGKNLELIEELRVIADEKNITIPQLAIAWLLSKGEDIVTLIGASRLSTLNDSLKSVDVKLSLADIEKIENIMAHDKIAGNSFPEAKFKNGLLLR